MSHLIYTIGRTDAYEQAFREQVTPRKLGRTTDYPGGSVWPNRRGAEEFLVAYEHDQGFSVYGVRADWDTDTAPSTDGPWHDLLRDADLVRLPPTSPVEA
jgi:hypothetical protein